MDQRPAAPAPLRVARRAALRIAGEQPDERLLDVGHGDVLLRLDPTMIVLSDAEGTEAMAPATMAAAPADPLAEAGDRWLAHLASATRACWPGSCTGCLPACARPGTASPRSPSTGSACGCGSRPRAVTTTCGSRSPSPWRAPAGSVRRSGGWPGAPRICRDPRGHPGAASRSGRVTFRSATKDTNGIVPASATSTARPTGQRSR